MILKYFIVFWFALGAIITVAKVGQVRKPTTPAEAAIGCVITIALIAAVLVWWPS